jgi:hypothetical protein
LTHPNSVKDDYVTAKENRIDDAELARLGIRRVESQVFQVGEYVYSNLSDALASAKRRDSK